MPSDEILSFAEIVRVASVARRPGVASVRLTAASRSCARRRRAGVHGVRRREAVGHSLLVVIWHMLSTGSTYTELGEGWLEAQQP